MSHLFLFLDTLKTTEIKVDRETTPNVFTITSVSSDVSGMYECIANNGIEPSLKSNFTVTIRGMQTGIH